MPRNKQIFTGRTIGQWQGGEVPAQIQNMEMQKWLGARVNMGMITTIDSADIPLEALQLAKNAKVIFDKTTRRDGLILFGPAAPNAFAVLKMASIKHPDGTGHTYRFTASTIHDLQAGVWNVIAETVPLAGTNSDRYQIASVLEFFAFTNNGANNVQWIDSTTDIADDLIDNLSADLGSSEFRYCTGFYNRVVLGALREENEAMIAWTGEYGSKATAKKGLEDLDPTVNETSGFAPLVDSPSDVSDFITGVLHISSSMVVLREKSLWVGTKQPSATNPFNFYSSVPGVGCDSPFSAKVTAFGVAFLDRRSRTVYNWIPGEYPEPIGRPIEKDIINNITDPSLVFGSYDPIEDSYTVEIPAVGSNLVREWTFYFRDKAWTYNEKEGISSFDDVELLTAAVTIDDLIGAMDDLIGTYDSLSPINVAISQRIYGRTDGTLVIPDENTDFDIALTGGLDYEYDTVLISKAFTVPEDDIYIAKIVVEYDMRIQGTLELWYSRNGKSAFVLGDSFTPTSAQFNVPQIITFYKVIKSRRYAWQLRATNGQFEILSYEVWVYPSGQSSMVNQNA